ncbi:hypothetical protein [Aggregatilinea lenta]|uniref:hypothetical protein n=1 Tax=Aggregatilinea lenta TaxID=913108 RepID=UPI000E5B485F|nr:hypothetical protein [Aggregatilinea lenta]
MGIETGQTRLNVTHNVSLRNWLQTRRAELISLLVLIAATLVSTIYVVDRMFSYGPWDYRFHVDLALKMKERVSIEAPHFLYHAFLILIKLIGPDFSRQDLASISIVVMRLAAAVVIFYLLLEVLPRPTSYRAGLTAVVLSLVLLIVTPITLRTWEEGRMYLGYIGVNAMHNPTILMLAPFALLLGWISARIAFSPPDRPGIRRDAVLAALLIVFSTLSKPSYLLCLLPAVGIIALVRLLRHERLAWGPLIFGIGIPGVILLVWQYAFTYVIASDSLSESGIIWSPLTIMRTHAEGSLTDKFLLSIAFPALVYLLFFPAARRDRFFTLSTLTFVFGAGYTYLLAETGSRATDGNFIWSSQIALFIWFVAAVQFLLRRNYPLIFGRVWRDRLRTLIVLAALGVHLFSGLVFQARGAIFINGYDDLPHLDFDFGGDTLESIMGKDLYDAYVQFSIARPHKYLTQPADAEEWGIVWNVEGNGLVGLEVINYIADIFQGPAPIPHAYKEHYYEVIYQIVARHHFQPDKLTPARQDSLTRWYVTGYPGDLRDAGARYLYASRTWLDSLSPDQQQTLLTARYYLRLPLDADHALFVAVGDERTTLDTLFSPTYARAYAAYDGPMTPVLLLPDGIAVNPYAVLKLVGDRLQDRPATEQEKDDLFGVIKAVTEEQYLPATFDDPAQQAAFDRWAIGKLPGDLRDAGVDYLLLDQRGYVIPYLTDVQRALIFASPQYYELIGEGLGVSLYRVTGEQTLDTLGLAPDTYAALEDYQPDFDPDWSPDTLVLNPTQGALTSRADVRQVMGVYLETTDDPAEDEVSAWFDRLKVVQNLVAPDDARLSAAQQAAVARWQTSRDPADLLDAGIGYVVFDDTWLHALPDAERATLSDPAQYAPVEDWQLDFYGEFYHLYRVLDGN